jgi:hypothetical protein
MAWPGYAYVLGTNKAHKGITTTLPAGTWNITRYDIINKTTKVISSEAQGKFTFDSPDSRALLFHFTIQ